MGKLDLNKLREKILDNQRDGKSLPAEQQDKVHVGREGEIVEGDSTDSQESRKLSEVHQGTFYSRHEREREIVSEKLPHNTEYRIVGEVDGWLYSFNDEFGERYQMFAYYDSDTDRYQVKVVFPEVEGEYNPHNGHLYSDGRICFKKGGGSGMRTLEKAYAKSVLWASGFTFFQEEGTFPFSINNS
jgi:hypothetical protein